MKRKNKIFQADLAAFKLMGYVLVFIWGMLCFLPFFAGCHELLHFGSEHYAQRLLFLARRMDAGGV